MHALRTSSSKPLATALDSGTGPCPEDPCLPRRRKLSSPVLSRGQPGRRNLTSGVLHEIN